MILRGIRAKIYYRLIMHKRERKAFHKRKLAVGFIRFRYKYIILDNRILHESFEPDIPNKHEKHLNPGSKLFTNTGF